MNFKKIARNSGVAIASVMAAGSAFAVAPTTVAELSTGVSFADVGLAVLAIAAALIALAVTIKGAKTVMRMIGR